MSLLVPICPQYACRSPSESVSYPLAYFWYMGLVLKGFHQIQTKIPIQAGIIWVYCCCPPIVVPPHHCTTSTTVIVPPAPLPHQHCCCPTTSSPSSAHGSPRFPALAPASDSGVPFQPPSHSHAGRPVLTILTIINIIVVSITIVIIIMITIIIISHFHSHAGRPVLTWDTIKLKPRRYLLNKTLFGMDFELVWITWQFSTLQNGFWTWVLWWWWLTLKCSSKSTVEQESSCKIFSYVESCFDQSLVFPSQVPQPTCFPKSGGDPV